MNNLNEFRAIVDKARAGQKMRMYVTTPGRGSAAFSRYTIVAVP